ncbi:MAG: hypothetical protein HY735_02270 [Verrucomicrobia bacterium]|nr:hypothetical protein [Verrucomicrobiota bacterium]
MRSRLRNIPFERPLSVLFLLVLFPLRISAQSDDFDDGNDAGWIRYSPLTLLGAPVKFGFPDDGLGGKAYLFEAPAPPIAEAGPARALSYRTNVYSDFYAAVDLVGWEKGLNQAFGFLFRAENIGLGTTTGYVLNYNTEQASGGRGQLQINRVAGERDSGTIGASNITLDLNHRYRLVLVARGSEFTAQIYDLLDLTSPLAGFTVNDSASASGVVGLFNYSRSSAVTDPSAGRAHTIFDNFVVASKAPILPSVPATPHSLENMPQVVDRTPASRSNFHDATKGIRFLATTLTTNQVNSKAMRLLLNGVDVSSGLSFSGTPSNLNVSFNGLTPNTAYDARVILEDFSNRKSTNAWTFDTFTEEFLNSAAVKVIEIEDYNYGGGRFQDNPPVSGLTSAGASVNGNGVGYYDQIGIPEIDYFDHSSNVGSGALPEYRLSDFTGTQAGSVESGTGGQENPIQNDTRRQKYSARDLPEYQVARTEGGEWLNYTRNFAGGDYRMYLRVAARAPQPVLLERVTSDPAKPNQTTVPLGTFQVPNLGLMVNYRYVSLTDSFGRPAVVSLSGLQTLRLAMGGPQENATQYTMSLNYLLLVPASVAAPNIRLESAPSVLGPYETESTATRPDEGTFETGIMGPMRFYRLWSSSPATQSFRITSLQTSGGKVVVKYRAQP